MYSSTSTGSTIAARSSRSSGSTRYCWPGGGRSRRGGPARRRGGVDGADEPAVGSAMRNSSAEPERSPRPGAGEPRPAQTARPSRSAQPVVVHQLADAVVEVVAPPPLVVGRERRSYAAQARWGSSTNGLARFTTAGSGGRREHLAGVGHQPLVELVGAGHEHRQRTLAASRPARPACCHIEAIVPGNPLSTQASSPPTSMPSSRALVATTPGDGRRTGRPRSPAARRPGSRRGTSAPSSARSSPTRRRTSPATSSVALRLRQNVTVRHPPSTQRRRQGGRLDVGRARVPVVEVEQRRVPEREEPLAARRPVVESRPRPAGRTARRPARPARRSWPT